MSDAKPIAKHPERLTFKKRVIPKILLLLGGFAVLVAVLGHFQIKHRKKSGILVTIHEKMAWKVLVAGLLVVLAEFFVFGTPANPF